MQSRLQNKARRQIVESDNPYNLREVDLETTSQMMRPFLKVKNMVDRPFTIEEVTTAMRAAGADDGDILNSVFIAELSKVLDARET